MRVGAPGTLAATIQSEIVGSVWGFSTSQTSYIDFGISNQPITTSGDHTVLVYANVITATPAAVQRAFSQRDVPNGNQIGNLLFNSSSGGGFATVDAGKVCFFGLDSGFANIYNADSAAILPSTAIWQAYVGRKIGAQPDVFVAGVKRTSASTTATGTYYSSGMQTYIGNVPNGLDQGANCQIAMVATWNRGLTDTEIWLLRDPTVLIATENSRRKFYMTNSSGTADVLFGQCWM